MEKKDFVKINDFLWEIPKDFRSDMRVPARVYVSEKMLGEALKDRSLNQLINVATLPGVVNYSLAMPDIHEGYGFPIGGVAAIRLSEGVISPGGVGYDINCLPSQSKILLDNGVSVNIGELEKSWQKTKVKFIDFSKKDLDTSSIIYFFKRYNNPIIFELFTQSGEKLEATGDHPVQTNEGMKEVRLLKEGDKVLIYPFKGIDFSQPSSKIIVSEDDFKKILKDLGKTNRGLALDQILKKIKQLNILPLRYDSWQLPYLLKIMGFIFGDGYISLQKNGRAIIGFNGKYSDLKAIREDLKKIGFNPSSIYQRKRKHKIKTHYKDYEFETLENSFKVSSFALAALLIVLGAPFGTKVNQSYRIPKWMWGCPLWQKRLFLAALFGAELSKPKTLNKYNFYAPQLNMQKAKGLEKNAKLFLKDIAALLKEFGIKTYPIKEVFGYHYQGKKGETKGFRLQIQEKADNLIRFFETINYEYNQEKHKEACLAANYLKRKLKVVELRKKARQEIRKLYRKRGDFKKIAFQIIEKYRSEYVTFQFLYHSLFKEKRFGVIKKRGNPRIDFKFLSFEEFKKKFAFGENGFVWDVVEGIKKNHYADFVYDFTINDNNHNFIANGFVVSNCGMRLLKSEYSEKDINSYLDKLAAAIAKAVPSGLGKGHKIGLSISDLDKVLEGGAQKLVENGYGEKEDIELCEANGCLKQADAKAVSHKAKNRGQDQLGTLGSGNHFLEIQKVAEIFNEEIAQKMGIFKNQLTVMIHTGSRGLGHQVATDYIQKMIQAMRRYNINIPDRELACAPFNSDEGQSYFQAMCAAANFAWANRQMISYYVREAWKKILPQDELTIIYDVAHNIAKIEEYEINGKKEKLIIHRKGSTRAFPAHHPEIPEKYKEMGQPVLIPGSMGTASYILIGNEKSRESFYSTCHGAGRRMSRIAATRNLSPQEIINYLKNKGILVKCESLRGLAEEAPEAYKDINEVVEIVHQSHLSLKVAKLVPLAVIKGE